ncbi:Holliday junction resolvase RuvX [Oceanidesulfovibrio marinus]|nr:Holliday junction resolvase RuvX [Oceanidesulfovibrio marinus]
MNTDDSMKYLAVDYGEKRVGLAVSDPAGTLAFPLKTLHNQGKKALADELVQIMDEHGVDALVLGLPVPGQGLSTQQALDDMAQAPLESTLVMRQIKNLAASLARRTDRPVLFEDETLSSFEAEEALRERGLSGQKLADVLDQQAAVRILETYLARSGDH